MTPRIAGLAATPAPAPTHLTSSDARALFDQISTDVEPYATPRGGVPVRTLPASLGALELSAAGLTVRSRFCGYQGPQPSGEVMVVAFRRGTAPGSVGPFRTERLKPGATVSLDGLQGGRPGDRLGILVALDGGQTHAFSVPAGALRPGVGLRLDEIKGALAHQSRRVASETADSPREPIAAKAVSRLLGTGVELETAGCRGALRPPARA